MAEIWEERKEPDGTRRCARCNCIIGVWDMDIGDYVPQYINFQHDKRGRGKDTWINKDEISLICDVDHMKEDQGINLIK